MAENPLGELILDAMRVQRIAFRTVAARAAEAGLPLSHSAIQRMARKPLELLSRDVVTALSAGLNINEDIVLSAALDTMGMRSPVPPMPTVREALLQDSALSLPSKNALLASYEAFASLPAPMPVGVLPRPGWSVCMGRLDRWLGRPCAADGGVVRVRGDGLGAERPTLRQRSPGGPAAG